MAVDSLSPGPLLAFVRGVEKLRSLNAPLELGRCRRLLPPVRARREPFPVVAPPPPAASVTPALLLLPTFCREIERNVRQGVSDIGDAARELGGKALSIHSSTPISLTSISRATIPSTVCRAESERSQKRYGTRWPRRGAQGQHGSIVAVIVGAHHFQA